MIIIEKPLPYITLIRLNRPEVKNALNRQCLNEICEALHISLKDDMRVVVITGNLEAFAAGADILEIEGLDARQALIDQRVEAWRQIRNFPMPLIAAVEGYCFGGGLELMMACDCAIAGDSAQFALPEVKLGLMPGGGGTQILPRLIGKMKAFEMMYSGAPIAADEALHANLISAKVATGEALSASLKLAERIARNAPFALRQIKQAGLQALSLPLEDGIRAERQAFAVLQSTQDKQRGITAFKAKSKPEFQGN